jgi:predicted alpha/beta hydrolase family esterase
MIHFPGCWIVELLALLCLLCLLEPLAALATPAVPMKLVVIPGNGGCGLDMRGSNWYGWLESEMGKRGQKLWGMEGWPDPYVAKESEWIPFLKNEIGVDENTVVIGHSSGVLAAMRLMERTKIRGAILISAAHTDLGDENERASGYFSRPWEWDRMVANAGFIHQFHSADDHLIPVHEARFVAESLRAAAEAAAAGGAEGVEGAGVVGCLVAYEELQGRGHFFRPFPQLLHVVDRLL